MTFHSIPAKILKSNTIEPYFPNNSSSEQIPGGACRNPDGLLIAEQVKKDLFYIEIKDNVSFIISVGDSVRFQQQP